MQQKKSNTPYISSVILGNGIDIVKIDRINTILEKYSSKFIKKIFSAEEINDMCLMFNMKRIESAESERYIKNAINAIKLSNKLVRYIANRFSLKESVAKSMGTGFRNITFHDIQITRDSYNKPIVNLSQNAKNIIVNKFTTHQSNTHQSAHQLTHQKSLFIISEIISEKISETLKNVNQNDYSIEIHASISDEKEYSITNAILIIHFTYIHFSQ